MNAVTTRPFEVSIGSAYSPYSLPGLHPGGFIGSAHQKPGEKRIVTTDQNGTLGTTRFLAAILENHQLPDGSVVVPEGLRPYLGGHEVFERVA